MIVISIKLTIEKLISKIKSEKDLFYLKEQKNLWKNEITELSLKRTKLGHYFSFVALEYKKEEIQKIVELNKKRRRKNV